MQMLVVVLERQDVVGALLDDLAGDGGLAPHRVNSDGRPLQGEQPEQGRDRGDLVRLLCGRDLAEHQPGLGCPGADQVERPLASPTIVRPPQRLPVDGHDLLAQAARLCAHGRLPDDGTDPVQEAAPQLVRVEQAEHPPERVVRGDPVRQRQECPQPGLLRLAVRRHRHPVVGPTDHRAQCDRQDVEQPMLTPPLGARVRDRREVLTDARPGQRLHPTTSSPRLGAAGQSSLT
jgi:hypothetical protein